MQWETLYNISHKKEHVIKWKQLEIKQGVDIQEEIQKLKEWLLK